MYFLTQSAIRDSFHILCLTRLPLTSAPSRIPSIPSFPTATECSLFLATYSNNSVSTFGQLSFRYSKPSVCITAAHTQKNRKFTTYQMPFHSLHKVLLSPCSRRKKNMQQLSYYTETVNKISTINLMNVKIALQIFVCSVLSSLKNWGNLQLWRLQIAIFHTICYHLHK